MPDVDLIVRRAVAEEAPLLIAFQQEMARETEELELDPQVLAAGVRAVFDDPGKGTYWVGVRANRVLGGLLTVPEWSDWRNGQVLWIHSVYVIPEARGEGVFGALFRALQAHVASTPGLRGLRLYVDKRNTSAQRIYERLGMGRDHYHLYEWWPPATEGGDAE